MGLTESGLSGFPSQKKSLAAKNKKWREKCVESAIDHAFSAGEFKTTLKEMRTNINMYNNHVDKKEMMEFCDPFSLGDDSFPIEPRNYPIAAPKINLLVGEEAKRRSDLRVRVINDDAISDKEKEIKKVYTQAMQQIIQGEGQSQQDIEQKLQELDKWRKYEYQDMRERRATFLLEHIKEQEGVDRKFNAGFLDALLTGVEIYAVDVVAGEPVMRKCNPTNIKVIRSSETHNIEDSDIILEYAYYSPGKVIDMFHDHLTPTQVKLIEQGKTKGEEYSNKEGINIGHKEDDLPSGIHLVDAGDGKFIADTELTENSFYLPDYSEDGSMLVTRVAWRSFQKVGKLKYYDPQTGLPQYELVSELREADTSLGEEIDWYWVTDWWEGTRIGKEIYVKMQSFPVKAFSMTNPSISQCPYVGTAYAVNDQQVVSLMGRMKPYQYLYNAFMWKTQEAFAKYKGVIGSIDLARTPDGWEFEDVLYYAERMGWMVEDSFKEGDKGAATGKMAGNLPSRQSPMNFDMSGYIQQNIAMLNFLKNEMGEISGVSKQREGAIEQRELVGNVDRAVTQSSHITEMYFSIHEDIKKRALTALLEASKYAYRGDKKKVQHVLDDMSVEIFEIDGDEFRELDFDIAVSNNRIDSEIYQQFMNLAQAGLQNDKLNFSQLMSIMTDKSISSIRRKIETAEEDAQRRQQQAAQQEQQARAAEQEQAIQAKATEQERELQSNLILEEKKQLHEKELKLMEYEKEVALKQLEAALTGDTEGLEKLKLELEERQQELDRGHEARENEKDRVIDRLDIASKERTAKARKPSPTAK